MPNLLEYLASLADQEVGPPRKKRRPQRPRLREYEDDSAEVTPDHSVRQDATSVRTRGRPTDFRSNVLPANSARPPDGWEFRNGRKLGVPAHGELQLRAGRSENVEDRRRRSRMSVDVHKVRGGS
jgi:hypothetical protein